MGVTCIAIYGSMRRSLAASFDDSLKIEARRLADLLEQDGDGVRMEFDPGRAPDLSGGRRKYHFLIVDGKGREVSRSPAAKELDLDAEHLSADRVGVTAVEQGRTAHVVSINVMPRVDPEDHLPPPPRGQEPRPVRITVAAEPVEVERTLSLLAWRLGLCCLAAISVVATALIVIVGRHLRPVNALATEIGRIGEHDLARRLDARGQPDEVLPIIDTLNGLLNRLALAFDRERAFTADASHELRTPIAGLRTMLEVCRSRPRSPADYESTMDDCLALTERLESMTRSLLALAVADGESRPNRADDVDLAHLVEQAWTSFADGSRSRGLRVTMDLPTAQLCTDRDKLAMVVSNLLDNAVSHADAGGTLQISAARAGDAAVLTVTNSGCAVRAEDAQRIFERLWRADSARSASGSHVGLGLSLVQRLVTLLRGTVSVDARYGRSFSVQVSIPAKAITTSNQVQETVAT